MKDEPTLSFILLANNLDYSLVFDIFMQLKIIVIICSSKLSINLMSDPGIIDRVHFKL